MRGYRRHTKQPVPRGPAFVPCGRCMSGWVPSAWDTLRMTRCACWKTHQEALQRTIAKEVPDARPCP